MLRLPRPFRLLGVFVQLNNELAWGLDVDGEGRKKGCFQLDIFPNRFNMKLQNSFTDN